MPVFHINIIILVSGAAALPPIHLIANASWWAAGGDPYMWSPAGHVGDPDTVPGF